MINILSKAGFLCLMALIFGLNPINAQQRLSVSRLKVQDDTTSLDAVDRVSVTIKNTGTQTFTGKIYVDYKSSGSTGGTTPQVLDSTKSSQTMNINDTVNISAQYFKVDQQNFSKGPNIVVVWPRAIGVSTVDSATTTIVVVDPAGVTEILKAENGFVLYPNPAYSRIYILPADSKISIENVRIYNNIGILVRSLKCNNNLVDIDGLDKGIYTLEIETDTHKRFVKRFLRE